MKALGITGGSGSGKSTIVRAIATCLGEGRVAVLRQDDYYRGLAHLKPATRAAANFDHPAAIEFDLLAEHVDGLRSGRTVSRPVYDMLTHTRTPASVRVDPHEVLLIEGTLIGTCARLRNMFDGMVFVDLEEPARLDRRIKRDLRERGRTEESIRRQWEASVAPMFSEFVEPERARADLVVRGDQPPTDLAGVVIAHLLQ